MRGVRLISRLVMCVALAVSGVACNLTPPDDRSAPTESSIRIASPEEPGQPLVISGILRDANGAPVANRVVRVTHDDARGASDRLSGTLRTDDYGRYLVRTVFPFAHGGNPAIVYFEVPGRVFPGQPTALLELSAPEARGSAGSGFRAIAGADGVWRVTADLRPGYNGPRNAVLPARRAPQAPRSGALLVRPIDPDSRPVRTRFTLEDSVATGR